MAAPSAIKLGIMSTAFITKTIVEALKPVPTCVCTAVASRDPEKARRFAAEHNIPTGCTYDELLTQPVDAIYIPLPTILATDWAVRAASAGYHVLVDKPFTDTEAVERILDACHKKGVLFMDATHFVHSSRIATAKAHINAGAIGDLKRIMTWFTVPIPMVGNIRADPELEPMGAAADLAWYAMRSAVTFLGVKTTSKILSVSCEGKYYSEYPDIVESSQGAVMFRKDGSDEKVFLSFTVDSACAHGQEIVIMGTTGQMRIPGFVVPINQTDLFEKTRDPGLFSTDTEIVTTKSVTGYDEDGNPIWKYPGSEIEVVKEQDGLDQPSMMMREFARMILENDIEAGRKREAETLATQRLIEAAYEKIKR